MDLRTLKPFWILIPFAFIFYFFIMRPKGKEEKVRKSFLEELTLGDAVVTIGGIHGVIKDLGPGFLVLALEDGRTRIRLQREAIAIDMTRSLYPKVKREAAAATTEEKKEKKQPAKQPKAAADTATEKPKG